MRNGGVIFLQKAVRYEVNDLLKNKVFQRNNFFKFLHIEFQFIMVFFTNNATYQARIQAPVLSVMQCP